MHYYQHTSRPMHCVVLWSADSEKKHPSLSPDRSVHRSFTRRDQLVKLGVDAHHVLVVSPSVFVEGSSCTSWSASLLVRSSQLILAVSSMTDCANSMAGFRVAPELVHVDAKVQLEQDPVCFVDGCSQLLGQSRHETTLSPRSRPSIQCPPKVHSAARSHGLGSGATEAVLRLAWR